MFRSQFEKSENAENNIKTTAAAEDLSSVDVNQSTTGLGTNAGTSSHSTVIDIHTTASSASKPNESKLKKPGTPKSTTPYFAGLEIKTKDKDAPAKGTI